MVQGRRLLFLLPIAALGTWGGCSLYGQDLLLPSIDGGTDATAPETGARDSGSPIEAGPGDSGASDAGTCPLAHPPPPPAADDPSDGGDLDILMAVRTFDLGLNDGGTPPPLIGYDLDGLCTCPGPADCVAAMGTESACDQPGGRDNAGGVLLGQFYSLSGGSFFSQAMLNAQIATGLDTLLVRVRNYNGTPNDTKVELSLYVSDGTTPGSDGGPTVPAWNGQDAWIADSRSVFGATGPPILPIQYDESAYVVGGVLVGSIDAYFVPLQLDPSDLMILQLQAGIVTGNLAQSAGEWSISGGVLDGRLLASNMLGAFAFIGDPDSNGDLCPTSPFYADLKGLICPGLDITANPSAPHTQTCDALSLAIGFAAQSAQFGPVETVTQTTTCPDAGPDHC